MNPIAKQLTEIVDLLPESEQQTLLAFAQFLKSQAPEIKPVIAEALDIPRPESESVIAAIKRLAESYPMIERSAMFGDTSDLMMQHTMSGRSAIEVIDEMEILFDKKLKEILQSTE